MAAPAVELPRKVVRRETRFPAHMAPEAKDRFAREIYAVHNRIFEGVPFDRFLTHVVDPPAQQTAIQVFYDENGRLVGYCAFHRYARKVQGQPTIVLRAEAGLLPEYRGRAVAHWFGMLGALREKIRHPFTRVVYFGTLVHPSSYRFFCKYFPQVYPRHDTETPAEIASLAEQVADSFQDPPVDPDNPLVRDVGWVTIQTLESPGFISAAGLEDARFFEARNPGYSQGHGLVVIVPVTMGNVGRAIAGRLREVVIGWARRHHIPL